MKDYDLKFMRLAIDFARKSRIEGNHPFGAILVDEDGKFLLGAENNVVTGRDPTGHAELNLVRRASPQFDREFLAMCTLYTSTEPCPMCAGAIFWANIRRVVYGLSEENLYKMINDESEEVLFLSCRELYAKGKKKIEVIGPLLEPEAHEVHLDFWD
jgi:tRNA(Arg) A34 adenosine deaminase TadA